MDSCARIEPVEAVDRAMISNLLRKSWGSTTAVTRGRAYDASTLPGFIARLPDGSIAGLITCRPAGDGCEVITLDSFAERQGIGSSLLEAARRWARTHGASRLWLITTNDNLDALRFYQRRGWSIVAVHPGAVTAARRIKPGIPLTGHHGIPIRDEVELELSIS